MASAAEEAAHACAPHTPKSASRSSRVSGSSSTIRTRSPRSSGPAVRIGPLENPGAPGRATGRRVAEGSRMTNVAVAVSLNRPAVELDEFLRDRQSETQSGVRTREPRLGLTKRLEQERQK